MHRVRNTGARLCILVPRTLASRPQQADEHPKEQEKIWIILLF